MAIHELFLLHLGALGAEDENGEVQFNQVPGYLIRAASGRVVLVDSGNPAPMIGAASGEPWWPHANVTRPQDDVVARLAELGITPDGVDLLVSTHFDFDHCGRHDAFAAAGVEFVVQRRHLAGAAADGDRFDPGLWNLPGIRYTEVDGDVELEPGLHLIETSGHAIGHQSVFVETAAGPVLLAIDAINRAEHLDQSEFPDWWSDHAAAKRSQQRLKSLAAATGATMIFGHDAAQWATLPKSPEPFRKT